MDRMQAIEIVNDMDLEEGHALTNQEADAIGILLNDAFRLKEIRESLGLSS